MSLNLEQKQAVVVEVAKEVAGAQAIVMAENRGLPVADLTRLRAKARASGVYFRVVKNTLVRRAVADTPFASLAEKMVGPLAYCIGPDPVAVAKVLSDFAKGNEKFVIAGGAMPGQMMSIKDIVALAALPSREVLLAKLAGAMNASLSQAAALFAAPLSQTARVVEALRAKVEEEGPATAATADSAPQAPADGQATCSNSSRSSEDIRPTECMPTASNRSWTVTCRPRNVPGRMEPP